MWPNVREGMQRPDCRDNGPHRWGGIHLDRFRSKFVQSCRICGELRWTEFKEKNGKITDSSIISTQISSDQRSDLI